MCPFCLNTKKVKVIDEPESEDQSLMSAMKKGQRIVEVNCPFCCFEISREEK